ncbi:caspase-7-like [Cylas formicarius]|uniref:caspase-7-like n=1 Tax=Cylas formicarius TaxID=197179 RepID=UPI002958445D|nr:caspase-7-like [Cylas formicarius]XP_060535297.1 caspase-7-like [Cylas formicarius]
MGTKQEAACEKNLVQFFMVWLLKSSILTKDEFATMPGDVCRNLSRIRLEKPIKSLDALFNRFLDEGTKKLQAEMRQRRIGSEKRKIEDVDETDCDLRRPKKLMSNVRNVKMLESLFRFSRKPKGSKSVKHAKVLIINNEHFDETKHLFRTGSSVDVENLKRLFKADGTEVIDHKDKSREEIRTIVREFAESEIQQDSAFVFVMSHGEDLGTDTSIICNEKDQETNRLTVNEIVDYFSRDKCHRSFRGKPKIFHFNLCRGKLQDEVPEEGDYHRNLEDVLIVHSTLPRSVSHRNPKNGSRSVESICAVFDQQDGSQPIDRLFSMVDQRLRENRRGGVVQTLEIQNIGFNTLFYLPPRRKKSQKKKAVNKDYSVY